MLGFQSAAGGDISMNEMPWWAILLIVVAIFLAMFLFMGIGMTAGEFAANVFLISVLAFAALIYAGVRWAVPRQKDDVDR
jgi:hypothetical protein